MTFSLFFAEKQHWIVCMWWLPAIINALKHRGCFYNFQTNCTETPPTHPPMSDKVCLLNMILDGCNEIQRIIMCQGNLSQTVSYSIIAVSKGLPHPGPFLICGLMYAAEMSGWDSPWGAQKVTWMALTTLSNEFSPMYTGRHPHSNPTFKPSVLYLSLQL